MRLLPACAFWALFAFFVSLLASWAGARVALAPLRVSAATAWFERARLAFPGRAVSRFAMIFLPLSFVVAVAFREDHGRREALGLIVVAAALPSLAATFLVRLHVERVTRGRRVGVGAMLRGFVALWAGVAPHGLVLLVAIWLVNDRFDLRTLLVLAVTTVAVLAGFAGGGVKLARLLGVARPASERLVRAVEAASLETGVKARSVFELDLMAANAAALPAAGILLFTPEAARLLDDRQLVAVARHELGHLSESGRVMAARLGAAVFVVVGLVLARPLSGVLTPAAPTPELASLFRLLVLMGVVLVLLVFVGRVLRPFARRMEARADRVAHAAEAADGEYARALESLYAANLMPAVTRVAGAHPHLYDRLVAAGAPPPWPRPSPPSGARSRAGFALCLGITAVALTAATLAT